eukprot:4923556-Alexandrium_andersonii.AAC.1
MSGHNLFPPLSPSPFSKPTFPYRLSFPPSPSRSSWPVLVVPTTTQPHGHSLSSPTIAQQADLPMAISNAEMCEQPCSRCQRPDPGHRGLAEGGGQSGLVG